jgi:hypothetical protein
MSEESTTAAVQRYLDAMAGGQPAGGKKGVGTLLKKGPFSPHMPSGMCKTRTGNATQVSRRPRQGRIRTLFHGGSYFGFVEKCHLSRILSNWQQWRCGGFDTFPRSLFRE